MEEIKGQLTIRGLVIGIIGCIIITASSIYVALRMGALPWPIVFAAIVSLFFLKTLSGGKASLNEANVTHTIMSSGAMVAGGLAFTVPGAWMLGLADDITPVSMLVCALGGTAVGLVASIAMRRHFIERERLEFPIGEAAAQTLIAGEKGGRIGAKLFGAMGFAGLWTFFRDILHIIPSMVAALPIPGVVFGIYASPMMLAVGFLVGGGAVAVWFAGAVIGNMGIIMGGGALGLCDAETGRSIVSALGMGIMIGCGFAVIFKDLLPQGATMVKSLWKRSNQGEPLMGLTAASAMAGPIPPAGRNRLRRMLASATLLFVVVAAAACLLLGLPAPVSLAVTLLAFITCAMSAQSVGQTGIDPMEVFGLIVVLLVLAFTSTAQSSLFLIAALVSVACGLAGDVMNDFKAGHTLGTSPKAQWIGQAVGGVVGSVVAVAVMAVLLQAFGPDAFGPDKTFVAAQASVVASMISGIGQVAPFTIGFAVGFILYLIGFPSMMLGLGIYLPFYMSLTAFLGCCFKFVLDKALAYRSRNLNEASRRAKAEARRETGLVIASGLLGGESIIGILGAIILSAGAFMAL